MDKIVFVESERMDEEPFTTSKVIAELLGMNHRRVKEAIRKHEKEFLSFGLLGAYETESTGGRPEEIVRLNEEQATFLMTLLKNTPKVVAFKKELVKQFFLMRDELMKRRFERQSLKPVRRQMTDAIQDNPNQKKWDYKLYTDLSYIIVVGKSAAKIRKERGAEKKDNAVEYLSAEEIERISKTQAQIAVLIDAGLEYQEIKSILLKKKK